ncbi:MAG: uroporphyrinogen-III synthase [Acidimicrobiales bacterium]
MAGGRPLRGRLVVVTRARGQAGGLVDRLGSVGAEAVELPVIEIGEPSDGGRALRAAAATVGDFHWVVFTSANGVERLLPLLEAGPALAEVRVAAIGPGTCAALGAWHVTADLVPPRFVAESLLEVFPAPPSGGGRVLLPRAAGARDVLPEGLRASGWEVEVVEAYRTTVASPSPAALAAARRAEVVTFTSSSTVTAFLQAAGADTVPPVVACIGPVTAATARAHGLTVDIEAAVHTTDGLVDALVEALGR